MLGRPIGISYSVHAAFHLELLRKYQTEFAIDRQVEEASRHASEHVTRNVDIRIRGNAGHPLTPGLNIPALPVFLAKFVNDPVYVFFLNVKFTRL